MYHRRSNFRLASQSLWALCNGSTYFNDPESIQIQDRGECFNFQPLAACPLQYFTSLLANRFGGSLSAAVRFPADGILGPAVDPAYNFGGWSLKRGLREVMDFRKRTQIHICLRNLNRGKVGYGSIVWYADSRNFSLHASRIVQGTAIPST